MVLALLKLFSYGYLEHPDGPAMMALIIASTSVARDAMELGHLRLLRRQGRHFVHVPVGGGFWNFLTSRPDLWAPPVAAAMLGVGLSYAGLAAFVTALQSDLGQFGLIGLLAGSAGTLAYIKGLRPDSTLRESLRRYPYPEMLRFFLWPGVAFAWTYDLIMLGITDFLFMFAPPLAWRVLVSAGIAGLLSLYCYYLGRCRWQEEKLHATIPPAMLRCPFITGLLSSKKA
jgi:hypothetical protein